MNSAKIRADNKMDGVFKDGGLWSSRVRRDVRAVKTT